MERFVAVGRCVGRRVCNGSLPTIIFSDPRVQAIEKLGRLSSVRDGREREREKRAYLISRVSVNDITTIDRKFDAKLLEAFRCNIFKYNPRVCVIQTYLRREIKL